MANYERLAASRYVVDAYVGVSGVWRRYEDSGDDDSLRVAAEMMCTALGQLYGDQEFWGAAIDAIREIEGEADAVRDVLANLSEFREIEERVLMKFKVPPDQASRLVSDLIVAIRMAEKVTNGDTLVNLQNRVGILGERMCEVAAADHSQRHKWRRRVVKGMRILGGGTLVVVDGLTTPPPLNLVSIGGGLIVMGADVMDE